jgi:hypothetical protein
LEWRKNLFFLVSGHVETIEREEGVKKVLFTCYWSRSLSQNIKAKWERETKLELLQ